MVSFDVYDHIRLDKIVDSTYVEEVNKFNFQILMSKLKIQDELITE